MKHAADAVSRLSLGSRRITLAPGTKSCTRRRVAVSVIMTLRTKGDPKKLEAQASADPDAIRSIAAEAKKAGLIAHRFYGSDDGQIMVVDEWPDPGSFQKFFEANQARIGPMMASAGATGEPEVTFWRKLDTKDDVGWDE